MAGDACDHERSQVQLKELVVIDCAATGSSANPALAHWPEPVAGVRWPDGWRSGLTLERPPLEGDLVVLLIVEPYLFLPALPRQALHVTVNGERVRQSAIVSRTVLVMRIAHAQLGEAAVLHIAFDHPDAARPDMFSDSTSDRTRSIGFSSIRLLQTPVLSPRPEPVAGTEAPLALPPNDELTDAQLMGYFASLGDNCEFGMVQRQHGAEPLDLLRFSGMPVGALIRGIDAAFEGIDSCDEVAFRLIPFPPRWEYIIHVANYDLQSHTYVFDDEMPVVRLVSRQLTKLALLRRLFATDLREAKRIFVYKNNRVSLHADVSVLADRLQARGPCTLLWVAEADATHPPGTVEVLRKGFLRGYVDHFSPYDDAARPATPVWLDVCREAYRLWRDSQPAVPLDTHTETA
jgi:hypothetical protein